MSELTGALPDLGALSQATQMALVVAAAALILFVQAVSGILVQAQTQRIMNRRLKFQSEANSTADLIVQLRRQRALNEEGDFKLTIKRLNQLITRSGLVFQPVRWAGMALAAGVGVAALVFWRLDTVLGALAAGSIVMLAGPYLLIAFIANRRTKKIGSQLPDALNIIVRSLEAGHPVPAAIGLVAREMPDPIGSEFGMAADEVSYGFSLTQAIERMAVRIGDPDVELFAATVRLQERTGGNLCDLLKTSAATVRERQTLRLKVKAASAEGRASALILTAAPFVVAAAIHLMRPQFYGLVIDEPLFRYSMVGFGVWMLIGNLIMNRMINFRV